MKPSSWDKQLGLASPLETAADQSSQTNKPSRSETGLDASPHTNVSPEGKGKYFLLTSFLIGLSVMAIYQQLGERRPPLRENMD
jgi:hypothetical protein